MSIFKDYKYERRITSGDYRVEIVDVRDTPSKKGKAMITVVMRLNTVNLRVMTFFVEGSPFLNSDLTEFYECFGIEIGNRMIRTWIGATGAVRLKEDGEFMRVARYLHPDSDGAKALPAWEGPVPERQTINTVGGSGDQEGDSFGGGDEEGEDELPF